MKFTPIAALVMSSLAAFAQSASAQTGAEGRMNFLRDSRAAKLSGTLPGAQQLDFNQWFVPGTSQFVDAAKAREIAAKVQRPQGQDMVAFCNTGHWAATDWFGLSEMAGLPNVKLYAGSMVDWTQSKDTPRMANQPGRAQSLAYDAQKWWEKTFK